MKQKFKIEQAEYLRSECEEMPKLRTFMTFKQFDAIPAYVNKPLSFLQRKYIAKIRLGSLELRIESGRFSRPRLEVHERLCLACKTNNLAAGCEPDIETEYHFIFVCSSFNDLRTSWLSKLVKPDNFESLNDGEKLSLVFNEPENVKSTAQFIIDAYNTRSKIVNK